MIRPNTIYNVNGWFCCNKKPIKKLIICTTAAFNIFTSFPFIHSCCHIFLLMFVPICIGHFAWGVRTGGWFPFSGGLRGHGKMAKVTLNQAADSGVTGQLLLSQSHPNGPVLVRGLIKGLKRDITDSTSTWRDSLAMTARILAHISIHLWYGSVIKKGWKENQNLNYYYWYYFF